jgi:hypothetical protein
MLGLIFTIIFSVIMALSGSQTEIVYTTMSNFLFHWYVWSTIVFIIIIIIPIFLFYLGLSEISDSLKKTQLGILGGTISIIILVRIIIERGLLILGSYLFILAGSGIAFDYSKLILGFIVLMIGLIIRTKK